MKNKNILLALLLVGATYTMGCKTGKTTEQKQVAEHNKEVVDEQHITEEQSDFLVMAANTRTMGKKIGELAQEKGTAQSVKDYGAMMVADQTEMLAEIETLAAAHNIELLDNLSKDFQKNFDKVSAMKAGKELDTKIVEMTSNGHERDLKEFEKAAKFDHKSIAAFATKYAPVVAKHLETAKRLSEEYNAK